LPLSIISCLAFATKHSLYSFVPLLYQARIPPGASIVSKLYAVEVTVPMTLKVPPQKLSILTAGKTPRMLPVYEHRVVVLGCASAGEAMLWCEAINKAAHPFAVERRKRALQKSIKRRCSALLTASNASDGKDTWESSMQRKRSVSQQRRSIINTATQRRGSRFATGGSVGDGGVNKLGTWREEDEDGSSSSGSGSDSSGSSIDSASASNTDDDDDDNDDDKDGDGGNNTGGVTFGGEEDIFDPDSEISIGFVDFAGTRQRAYTHDLAKRLTGVHNSVVANPAPALKGHSKSVFHGNIRIDDEKKRNHRRKRKKEKRKKERAARASGSKKKEDSGSDGDGDNDSDDSNESDEAIDAAEMLAAVSAESMSLIHKAIAELNKSSFLSPEHTRNVLASLQEKQAELVENAALVAALATKKARAAKKEKEAISDTGSHFISMVNNLDMDNTNKRWLAEMYTTNKSRVKQNGQLTHERFGSEVHVVSSHRSSLSVMELSSMSLQGISEDDDNDDNDTDDLLLGSSGVDSDTSNTRSTSTSRSVSGIGLVTTQTLLGVPGRKSSRSSLMALRTQRQIDTGTPASQTTAAMHEARPVMSHIPFYAIGKIREPLPTADQIFLLREHTESLEQWEWDIFSFSLDDLSLATYSMFKRLGLMSHFEITQEQMCQFLSCVQQNYYDNPYHNYRHAVDVAQTLYVFLWQMGAEHYLSPINRFSVLLAALCHDLSHPGLDNAYQVGSIMHTALLLPSLLALSLLLNTHSRFILSFLCS
jgi:hypothetical protein